MATLNIMGGPGIAVNASDNPEWGIFTPKGDSIYIPTEGGTLSFFSLGFMHGVNVSDFPIESAANTYTGAGFASYNKVYRPYNPIVTLSFSGTIGEKIAFLHAIQQATISTDLFNIRTPDVWYSKPNGDCTVERYSYQRSAIHGASLLLVEISLQQVKEVVSYLSNSVINNPQSPSAQGSVSSGNVQTEPPNTSTSTLYDAAHGLGVR